MAAINFPSNPTVGDSFTVGERSWKWDGESWTSESSRGARPIASATAPSNPFEGDTWFNSTTGQMLVYYDGFWVEAVSTTEIESVSLNTVTGLQDELDDKVSIEDTGLGKGNNPPLVTFNSAADYANVPVGYSAMLHDSSSGMPLSNQYGFFTKIANRNAQDGWGGVWIDHDNPLNVYVGTTSSGTNYADWKRLAASSYDIGLVEIFSIFGENDSYTLHEVDTSQYAGALARVVFLHTGASGFAGDLQLDAIRIADQLHSFENGENHNYQRSPSRTSAGPAYNQVQWEDLDETTSNGQWAIETGNTGSPDTGELGAYDGSYFVYTEATGDGNKAEIWLRSPVLPIGDSIKFAEGRDGEGMGTLKVYLDIVR